MAELRRYSFKSTKQAIETCIYSQTKCNKTVNLASKWNENEILWWNTIPRIVCLYLLELPKRKKPSSETEKEKKNNIFLVFIFQWISMELNGKKMLKQQFTHNGKIAKLLEFKTTNVYEVMVCHIQCSTRRIS